MPTQKEILRLDSKEVRDTFSAEEIEAIKDGKLAFEVDNVTYHMPSDQWDYCEWQYRLKRMENKEPNFALWNHADVKGTFILGKGFGERLNGNLVLTEVSEELRHSPHGPGEKDENLRSSGLEIKSIADSQMNLRRGQVRSISFYTAKLFSDSASWSIHCYREPTSK